MGHSGIRVSASRIGSILPTFNPPFTPHHARIRYDDEVGVDRLNTELVKFGVRGVSTLFASGDDGTGCYGAKYMPNYPASSPYTTAVGGVYIPVSLLTNGGLYFVW